MSKLLWMLLVIGSAWADDDGRIHPKCVEENNTRRCWVERPATPPPADHGALVPVRPPPSPQLNAQQNLPFFAPALQKEIRISGLARSTFSQNLILESWSIQRQQRKWQFEYLSITADGEWFLLRCGAGLGRDQVVAMAAAIQVVAKAKQREVARLLLHPPVNRRT